MAIDVQGRVVGFERKSVVVVVKVFEDALRQTTGEANPQHLQFRFETPLGISGEILIREYLDGAEKSAEAADHGGVDEHPALDTRHASLLVQLTN